MKTIGANLLAHIAESSTTLAILWEITRADGTILRFTDHDQDITYSGNLYSSAIVDAGTALVASSDFSVDNMDVLGLIDSVLVTDDDLLKGLYDNAEIRVSIINYKVPADGIIMTRRGTIGEVSLDDNGTYTTELRGMTQALDQQFIKQYSTTCRDWLGGPFCQIPLDPPIVQVSTAYSLGDFMKVSTGGGTNYDVYENRIYECTTAGTTAGTPPTYDTVVGNTTTDGTVVWTTREAWTRYATVASVTDNRTFSITVTEARAVDDWFKYGQVYWDTGNNSGLAREIKSWTNSGSPPEAEISLFLPAPFDISIGDELRVNAGCDKLRDTCRDRFANVINRQAEDYIPGLDEVLKFPDAK
jgi:hypothetical protein